MKLLGRDIPARELIARIEERLRTRGLPTSEEVDVPPEGVEPRVEPLTFNLHALEENADATRALPLHTHRGGVGQAVLLAKWAFRKSCQVFINETLGRQRVFNGHVRDAYAQLSAEVIRLRREVETLRAQAASTSAGHAPLPKERPARREDAPATAPVPAERPAAPSTPVDDAVLPRPRENRPASAPAHQARPKKVSAPAGEVTPASAPRAKKGSAPSRPQPDGQPASARGGKKRRHKKGP
ncbi:Glutamate synthase [NADPH] large chain [Myxococcus hansupus]|uniref:Glutamate synthase [NADPH] large chain n=1 Tax=Pseudomyxococcus hansupus TaxID=1297742 RepID=A0A0H4WTN9_9BACT|nr:hypothetical protein [Myxococcus hansupus]AKQ64665.1 Glutamate synthase [NADPH] large chain [Myxococcus hansupus]